MVNYPRELLVGNWFRQEQQADGQQFAEEAIFSPDGCFEFIFSSLSADGQLIDQIIELGDWGLVGDVHFTITKTEISDQQEYAADMADKDNYQVYRVLQLTSQVFAYQHILSEEKYLLLRVTEHEGHSQH
jgi:hypothetical protein